MKCFYHSADLDGHCSGAIVKHKYPECEMIGIDYGQEFPWKTIQKGETVFMVDFSLQPFNPDMIELNRSCGLVWIEHHKSAIQEWQAALPDGEDLHIEGAKCFDNSQAACELTWEYLFKAEVPPVVRLLSLYDVWNHKNPDVLPFQYGMRLEDTKPENQILWGNLLRRDWSITSFVQNGQTVLKYTEQSNKKKAASLAFDTELDGLRCVAMNSLTNSQGFGSVWDSDKYDAMLSFCWKYGTWTVSLFSDKPNIDVSEIAKSRGGGGHKGAAGFQCKELPFQLN